MLSIICHLLPNPKNGGQTLGKKANKTVSYIRINDTLAQKLDRRIKRMGYTSRSEFFTAVAYTALGKTNQETTKDLPKTTRDWIDTNLPKQTEDEIQKTIHDLIAENLTAAIAMKGIDIAFENTWEDIRELCKEQTGIWTTESELREAYETFAAIHKTELTRYRENQLNKKP